ncbi:hypothetical protein ABZ915_41340 [Streptomyces sp. NPDC046915]|uniref:hypothetical protein n=1 Tax=Streptomyces sp. NPDC046915 TaxID=3155257 RepID=UPI003410CF1F
MWNDFSNGIPEHMAGQMILGTMADLTADITPDERERIDAIKAEMADAERGHELAALRKARSRLSL